MRAVVVKAAAGVDGGTLAGQGNEGLLQRLAAHEGKFSTTRTINDLRV